MFVFINDQIASADVPLIRVNDRGFLLGDGLFETLKAINNRLLHFPQHFARLRQSAKALAIPLL
jgi:branched-chain amino acid aminotransferase